MAVWKCHWTTAMMTTDYYGGQNHQLLLRTQLLDGSTKLNEKQIIFYFNFIRLKLVILHFRLLNKC